MLSTAPLAERFAYGHPLDPPSPAAVPIAPRSKMALLGRILISVIFILGGITKLTSTDQTAAYMSSVGIPAAHTLAIIAGIAELLGGISVLFGLLARVGALGLLIYLIPTTLLFHAFWKLDGQQAQMQMTELLKNLAVMGGLSMLVAFGPGLYSLDRLVRRPRLP